jgi:hypothetical protein
MGILFVHIVRMLKIMFGMKKVITRMIIGMELNFISKNTDITVYSCDHDRKTG